MSMQEFEVHQLLDRRSASNGYEYLVHWKGFQLKDSTWEPESNLTNAEDALYRFHELVMPQVEYESVPQSVFDDLARMLLPSSDRSSTETCQPLAIRSFSIATTNTSACSSQQECFAPTKTVSSSSSASNHCNQPTNSQPSQPLSWQQPQSGLTAASTNQDALQPKDACLFDESICRDDTLTFEPAAVVVNSVGTSQLDANAPLPSNHLPIAPIKPTPAPVSSFSTLQATSATNGSAVTEQRIDVADPIQIDNDCRPQLCAAALPSRITKSCARKQLDQQGYYIGQFVIICASARQQTSTALKRVAVASAIIVERRSCATSERAVWAVVS